MNRNALFQTVKPDVSVGRSQFDLSKRRLTTFNQGDLVPLYVNSDILPGDTFDVSTAFKLRTRTPLAPVLDNCKFSTYWFFVPYRLVWDHTKEFYGENNTSAWVSDQDYVIPGRKLQDIKNYLVGNLPGTTAKKKLLGSLYDYFGLPIEAPLDTSDMTPDDVSDLYDHDPYISVLPFRAYKKIWNDWFRDENLQDPELVPTGDTVTSRGEYACGPDENLKLLKACKIHDYFTSSLPGPQKGSPVFIPLVGVAPVGTGLDGKNSSSMTFKVINNPLVSSPETGDTQIGVESLAFEDSSGNTIVPNNLAVDLSAVSAVGVNALRLAVASQRILERYARGGSRFTEFLRSFFGIVTPEAVLQIPQYLGGQDALIVNNQVLQTSMNTEGSNIGNTGAFSLTMDSNKSFVHSFQEPGILMCLGVARVEHTYEERVDRMWTRRSFFDFYTPPLAHLGEQPVYNYELNYRDNATDFADNDGIFGFKEAWTEYRFGVNDVTSEMRPSAAEVGMRPWQYTDHYDPTAGHRPTLSAAWISEGQENVNQTLAVSSSLADQFFGDFYFHIKATRPLPVRSTPGLMDHF